MLQDMIACMQYCPLSLSGKPSIAAAVDRTLIVYHSLLHTSRYAQIPPPVPRSALLEDRQEVGDECQSNQYLGARCRVTKEAHTPHHLSFRLCTASFEDCTFTGPFALTCTRVQRTNGYPQLGRAASTRWVTVSSSSELADITTMR